MFDFALGDSVGSVTVDGEFDVCGLNAKESGVVLGGLSAHCYPWLDSLNGSVELVEEDIHSCWISVALVLFVLEEVA